MAGKRSATGMFTGGCLCGSIRFEADAPALAPHTCSCRMCQRHTGALTAVWVEFPKEAVRWVGPGGAPSTYRSSEWSSRAFCPACGSSLGAIDDKPTVGLVTGVFDRPAASALKPTAHSYRSGRPRWWQVDVREPARRRAVAGKPALEAAAGGHENGADRSAP